MLLPDLCVEVAPVSPRHDQAERLQLCMHAFASLQEIRVDRIGWREPDARKAVLVLPGQPLQALLRLRLIFSAHEFSMTADYSGLADLIVSASKGYRASGPYRS